MTVEPYDYAVWYGAPPNRPHLPIARLEGVVQGVIEVYTSSRGPARRRAIVRWRRSCSYLLGVWETEIVATAKTRYDLDRAVVDLIASGRPEEVEIWARREAFFRRLREGKGAS